MNALAELQQCFQRAVLAEEQSPGLFVAEGADINGGFSLYLVAYRARLAGALRDNFPVLHRALGDEAFDELARDYIEAHPSHFRSIRWFGDALVGFLDANLERLPHPALADIARMDWAICCAFDAADAASFTLSDLAALSPEEWPAHRFSLLPSACVIDLAWRVEPIWRALNENAEAETAAPEPSSHALLVWRPQLEGLWRSIEAPEAAALRALMNGATFAECCIAIAETGAPDPATIAAGLLQRWVLDGLLSNP